jgi:fructokinase
MTGIPKNPSVIALGEILWDFLPSGKLLGGAPANFCHRLRQLGATALMVSRVGKDALGKELLDDLQALNFDLSLIQEDETQPTGTVDVSLSEDGNPTFTINTDVAYDRLEATPQLFQAIQRASLICFGTLVQRSTHTRDTVYQILDHAPNATKFLDINLRKNCYSAETVRESLKRADILKLNTSEVSTVSDLLGLGTNTPRDLAHKVIAGFGVNTVLVTLGEKGVYALDGSGQECTVPGITIQVLDTIGSGDSFAAGFVFTYLSGAPLEECCYFGNLIGALNATKKGGMPDISHSELQHFLGQHYQTAERPQ